MANELGWRELRAGRWEAARAAFTGAEETADALEGLSWAAWWLDDAETVFAARERAYRLYRQDGDATGAARMAIWLAVDESDFHGAAAVASGWLQRAHRLLDPLEPGPDHGWLAFHEGYGAHTAGDGATARELAAAAAEAGRRFGVPDLEMLGLALEGSSLASEARVEEGMRCLDEATAAALADEATIPISSAWTCCFLVTACNAVLDFDRAAEWCDRIAEFAGRYGSRYMLGFCRAEYGTVQLWRGRWAQAESLFEEAIAAYARSRPPYLPGPLTGLAELRRRQGRVEEAASLLEQAGTAAGAQLCRARLALDADDALAAVELLERLRRQADGRPGPTAAPVLELLVRARIARGELDRAAAELAELRALERRVGTSPLRACADHAEGLLASAAGEHERARRCSRTPSTASSGAVRPTRRHRRGSSWPRAWPPSAVRRPRAAERSAAQAALRELGAAAAVRQPDPVTPREREVLALIAEGLTNRQIAERLVVSEHTVHRHVTNILRKLDQPSRTAAATQALRAGLLEP